jgi:hypothetical protein
VPDPLPAGVVELVRQPLVFQELVPLGMEEQRLSTSAKKTRNKLDDLNLFNDVKTALKNIIHLIIYNNSSRSINS